MTLMEQSCEIPIGRPPAPPVTRVELLKLTLLLLEAGWCQKVEAEDADGGVVLPGFGLGRRWCLRGALKAAARMLVYDMEQATLLFLEGYAYLQEILRQIEQDRMLMLEEWNDQPEMTQARIVAFVETAIACLK